jgi:hypothetical protein
MATLGHSGSQAEQAVQVELMILWAMVVSGWVGKVGFDV